MWFLIDHGRKVESEHRRLKERLKKSKQRVYNEGHSEQIYQIRHLAAANPTMNFLKD